MSRTGKGARTEVGVGSRCDRPDQNVVRRTVEMRRLRTKEVVECCSWGSMGHPRGNLGDSSAQSSVDSRGPASVSARNSISKWTGAHTRDILAKNRSTFCPCPKNLPEAKLKRN